MPRTDQKKSTTLWFYRLLVIGMMCGCQKSEPMNLDSSDADSAPARDLTEVSKEAPTEVPKACGSFDRPCDAPVYTERTMHPALGRELRSSAGPADRATLTLVALDANGDGTDDMLESFRHSSHTEYLSAGCILTDGISGDSHVARYLPRPKGLVNTILLPKGIVAGSPRAAALESCLFPHLLEQTSPELSWWLQAAKQQHAPTSETPWKVSLRWVSGPVKRPRAHAIRTGAVEPWMEPTQRQADHQRGGWIAFYPHHGSFPYHDDSFQFERRESHGVEVFLGEEMVGIHKDGRHTWVFLPDPRWSHMTEWSADNIRDARMLAEDMLAIASATSVWIIHLKSERFARLELEQRVKVRWPSSTRVKNKKAQIMWDGQNIMMISRQFGGRKVTKWQQNQTRFTRDMFEKLGRITP